MIIESTSDNNSTNPAITYSECYALLSLIPKEQIDRVFNQKECDIDIEFLPLCKGSIIVRNEC